MFSRVESFLGRYLYVEAEIRPDNNGKNQMREPGKHQRVAVKIVDDWGVESLRVLGVG